MTAITTSRLDTIRGMPIALPQTQLRRADSIVISSYKLDLGQRLIIHWLSLKMLKVISGSPIKINSSLGLVYVGVFAGGFDPLRVPSGVPLHVISLGGPGSKVLNPHIVREFSGPDIIEVVAVNNMTNIDLEITITGSAKYYITG